MTTVGPSPRAAHFPHNHHDSPSPYATPLLTVRNLERQSDTIEVVSAWRSALLSPSPSPRLAPFGMGDQPQDVKPVLGRGSIERDSTPPVYRSPPLLSRLDTTPIREHIVPRDSYTHHQVKPRTTPTGAVVYPTPVSVTEGPHKTYGHSPQLLQRPYDPRQHHAQPSQRVQLPQLFATQHRTPAQSPEPHPAYYRAHSPRAPQPEPRAAPSPYSPYRSAYFPPSIRGTSAAAHHPSGALGLSPYGLNRPKLSIHPYAAPHHDARDAMYHSAGAARHNQPFGGRDWAGPGSAISPGGIKAPRKRADDLQLSVLTDAFERSAYPSTEERDALARELGMTSRSVQIWFQNRRRAVKVEQQSALQRAEAEARTSGPMPSYLSHMSHQLMTPPQSLPPLDARHRPSAPGVWRECNSPASSSMTVRELPVYGSPQSRVASTSYCPSEPRDSVTSPENKRSSGYPTPLATKAEALTLGEKGRTYEAFHAGEERGPLVPLVPLHRVEPDNEEHGPSGMAWKGNQPSGLVGRFFNAPQGPAKRAEEECSPKSEPLRRQEPEKGDVNMP